MWYPEKNTIDFLNEKLNLPASRREQDWEIELANPDEIANFLHFYETQKLSPKQQEALIALVLASFEDALTRDEFNEELWEKTVRIVRTELKIFKDVLESWICVDSDADDEFEISPFIKILLDEENA